MNNRVTYIIFLVFLQIGISFSVYGQKTIKAKNKKEQSSTKAEEDLAMQYYRNKEYDKAVSIFKKIYNKTSSHFIYTNYLKSLIAIEQYKESEKLVRQRIKRNPKISRYEIDLGFVFRSFADDKKADQQYDKVLKNINPSKNAYVHTGRAFISRQETDYAVKTFKMGREVLDEKYLFNSDLARAYEFVRNYEDAFNSYFDLALEPKQLQNSKNNFQRILKNDPDFALNELFRTTLLKKIQKNSEEKVLPELMIWYSIQQKDFALALDHIIALDSRFNENGARLMRLSDLSVSNKSYGVAKSALEYVVKKGTDNTFYTKAKISLLDVNFLQLKNTFSLSDKNLKKLISKYEDAIDEFGENAQTIPLLQNYAHLQSFYLNNTEKAIEILKNIIIIPQAQPLQVAQSKIELADIYLYAGNQWEAILLYSQVEKSFKESPIGHKAKFKNAKLSFYISEFEWAKAQLDVLKSATSKLIANDAMDLSLLISDNIDIDSSTVALSQYAKADLASFRNQNETALNILDSIIISFPGHPIIDEVMFKKAQIYIEESNFEVADKLLDDLSTTYYYDILADDALFKRAKLQQNHFDDKVKAMELYQKILLDYPSSLYTAEARKQFRKLRGDVHL